MFLCLKNKNVLMSMKRIFFVLLSASLSVSTAFACTNFIVGKKASADGSVFVTYNADSYGAFMPLAQVSG